MKTFQLFLLILFLAASAAAADLSNHTDIIKTDSHLLQNLAFDREGGETIADAMPIPGLPFSDTGATCDNIDDYDSPCPYYGSTSPDVVYSLVLTFDALVTIDLCGSLYDTKVFVFDENLEIVACNDDFYTGPPCGAYVSKIEDLLVNTGEIYYIVVDGYGGDCGEYQIHLSEFPICGVECPPEGVLENEPELVDGYVDNYNGGCNSEPPAFQPLIPDQSGCLDLCGISGWYTTDSTNYRDTDWFEAVGTGDDVILSLIADYSVTMFVLLPDCTDPVIAVEASGLPFEMIEMVYPTAAGQMFWVWVGPQDFTGWVNEFDYVLTVCGLDWPVEVEPVSWGGIKAMYR